MWTIFTVVLLPPGGHGGDVIVKFVYFCLCPDFSIWFDFVYAKNTLLNQKKIC